MVTVIVIVSLYWMQFTLLKMMRKKKEKYPFGKFLLTVEEECGCWRCWTAACLNMASNGKMSLPVPQHQHRKSSFCLSVCLSFRDTWILHHLICSSQHMWRDSARNNTEPITPPNCPRKSKITQIPQHGPKLYFPSEFRHIDQTG